MATADNPYKSVTSTVGADENVLKDFFAFLTKGNILDLAIGSILGSAFSSVATSVSQDMIVPIVGSLVNVDMSNGFYIWKLGKSQRSDFETIQEAEKDGAVVIKYGKVMEKGITFVTQAIVLYFMIRAYQKAKEQLRFF